MYLLHEILGLPESLVGAKALRLAQLQAAGHAVKPAVVLVSDEVIQIAATGTVSEGTLRQIFSTVDFKNCGVAVRSSGESEDGKFSWPGQFKSKLNVTAASLADALIECATAAENPSVKTYGQMHGITSLKLALIVQEMVDAEWSGVLFTHDPLTLDHTTMVVEAASGIAEELVSGKVAPVQFFLDSCSGIVKNQPVTLSNGPSLAAVQELTASAERIRHLFGGGQDIEWAMERGTGVLYTNQARDITTDCQSSPRTRAIASVSERLLENSKHFAGLGCQLRPDFLSDQNVSEILGRHPSRMAFGLFTYCFADGDGAIKKGRNQLGYDIGDELEKGFFHLVAGQPRCSIAHDAFTYRISGIPLTDYCRLVDYYLEKISQDPKLANYPEVVLYEQNPSSKFLSEVFGTRHATRYYNAYQKFHQGIRGAEDSFYALCSQELLPNWDAQLKGITAHNPSDLAGLSSQYRALCDLLRTNGCVMFVKAARLGFFAFARLRNLLSSLFGQEADGYLNQLGHASNSDENPNIQFNHDLLALRKGSLELEELIVRYGHLSGCELEVSQPRYREQPELLAKLSQKVVPGTEYDSREMIKKLILQAGSRGEELNREIFMAQKYLALRETTKFHYLKAYDHLRRTLVKMEKVLGWEEGDIFFLSPKEAFNISANSAALSLTILDRKAIHCEQVSVSVPPVLSCLELQRIGKEDSVSNSSVLTGIGVTNSVAVGRAVVLHSIDDVSAAELSPGCILVTQTTDPAWSPLLSIVGKSGGLVTEVGGLLAHGAIYSREMGIAAVLNVQGATAALKTGMKVKVNGPAGTVEILQI